MFISFINQESGNLATVELPSDWNAEDVKNALQIEDWWGSCTDSVNSAIEMSLKHKFHGFENLIESDSESKLLENRAIARSEYFAIRNPKPLQGFR